MPFHKVWKVWNKTLCHTRALLNLSLDEYIVYGKGTCTVYWIIEIVSKYSNFLAFVNVMSLVGTS